MYRFCDLHVHSNNSDGSYSPEWIIEEAEKRNLIVALTDHNTTKGLESFMLAAEKRGITAVPGVELSTVHGDTELHIVGLFIDQRFYEKVESLVEEFHKLKEKSNLELVSKLNEAGYMIDYSSIKKRNVNGNVNRAHFASELTEKGYVNQPQDAFKTLLKAGGGFYTPPERLKTEEAIAFLREIEAVPVWAHPLFDVDENFMRNVLPDFCTAGLLGIETMHSSYNEEKIRISREIAKEFDLLESGGSDFHGEAKPNIKMGVGTGNLEVPSDFYDKLLNAKRSLDKTK